MTLRQALMNQGNSVADTEEILKSMVEDLNNDGDPEDILEEYGLEPDYVMDLLDISDAPN